MIDPRKLLQRLPAPTRSVVETVLAGVAGALAAVLFNGALPPVLDQAGLVAGIVTRAEAAAFLRTGAASRSAHCRLRLSGRHPAQNRKCAHRGALEYCPSRLPAKIPSRALYPPRSPSLPNGGQRRRVMGWGLIRTAGCVFGLQTVKGCHESAAILIMTFVPKGQPDLSRWWSEAEPPENQPPTSPRTGGVEEPLTLPTSPYTNFRSMP